MKIKERILRLYWVFRNQFGLDPRTMFFSLMGLPRYLRDFQRFRRKYPGRMELLPCLQDWTEEAGGIKNEYFWQDLLVARRILRANSHKHVDIGSRVDGFIAHVASFREIEVFDVRPISTQIPGVIFKQVDFTKPLPDMAGYCDSVSCLHALEHFGLGRYGDPVNPNGVECALSNMAGLLKGGGTFYLSVPIGIERVEFNAQRVFDPLTLVDLAIQNSLQLRELTVIRKGHLVEQAALDPTSLSALARQRYALGIFIFTKEG